MSGISLVYSKMLTIGRERFATRFPAAENDCQKNIVEHNSVWEPAKWAEMNRAMKRMDHKSQAGSCDLKNTSLTVQDLYIQVLCGPWVAASQP